MMNLIVNLKATNVFNNVWLKCWFFVNKLFYKKNVLFVVFTYKRKKCKTQQ